MLDKLSIIPEIIKEKRVRRGINRRIWQLTRQVLSNQRPDPDQKPVIFFNASTRLTGISQNAAFSLLAAMGLQLAGVPVIHFACRAGLSRCVLGTNRHDPGVAPPCKGCIAQSGWLYANAPTVWFENRRDPDLEKALQPLSIDELAGFTYFDQPVGSLVLPSMRWVLRRHHLIDDAATRQLFREYIHSAHHIGQEFATFIDRVEPRAVIVFNGMFYPEAMVRWTALQRGIRVVTHEVGLRPYGAFFTDGEATAYPLDIPPDFELSAEQDAQLDEYLSQRFQGKFSMAGIKFWPEMRGLDPAFMERASHFHQIVPVFTNVIFDTSQPHSNVVFAHMFAWLDLVLEVIREHRETLFVLRAHPDEDRPGKESNESVQQWADHNHIETLPNVVFIPPSEYFSSYQLIQQSKFVTVYNSTIGLEASILGAPVLCAGKSRFTQIPTVFFPDTPLEYRQMVKEFLAVEHIDVPVEFRVNARRFLYYQLFRSTLPFGDFLEEDGVWPGFVQLRSFPWQKLSPEESPTVRVIVQGITNGDPFTMPDESAF